MSRLGPTGLTQLLTNIKTWVTTKLGNYVTTDTTQTITGKKSFTNAAIQLNSLTSMSGSMMFINTSASVPRGAWPTDAHRVGRIYIGDGTSYNGAWFIVDPIIDTTHAVYRMVTTNPDNTDSTRFSIVWDSTKTGARCRKNVSQGDLLPSANNTYNLGAADLKWDIGYIHNLIGSNKDNLNEDANNYYSTTNGSHMTFYTTSDSSTKLSNVPAAVNTQLESRTIKYLSSSDWTVEQICHNTSGLYYRKGTNGTWEDWKTFAFTNSNITGTAANVTGTVAIANGGTGATTRLNAVKALTNEAVSTPTHFLTITTNWGKAGYTTVAQAKTVLGITGDIVSHNASEFLTASGNETVTGTKIFNGDKIVITQGNGYRMVCNDNGGSSGYGVFQRVDDSTWYLMVTAQDDALGTWTSARPASMNLSTGVLNINGKANEANKVQATIAAGTTAALVQGNIASNDYFRIAVGGDANAGWSEIATADDGNEPIYVRQYKGTFTTLQRTATLLDGSGNTSFPGTVTATGFSGPVSGNASSATEFSANKDVTLTGDVTGTASSKAGWSVTTALANSGVTAGTYGPSANVTGSNNATILVPEITVDAKGRVTSVTNRTYTSVNTDSDKKVYQYYKSDDNVYRLLFSNNSGNTTTSNVGAVYSGLNNSFYVNPSAGSLYATKLYSGGTEVSVSGHTHTKSDITDFPTNVSAFTNDAGYLTSHQSLSNYVTIDTAQDIEGNKNFKGLLTTIPNDTIWPVTASTTDDITYLGANAIHVEQKGSGKLTDLSNGAWSVAELGVGCFFFRINNGTDIRYKHLGQNTVNRIPVVSGANRFINDVTPNENNTYSLGTSSLQWKNAYAVNIYENGTALTDKYAQVDNISANGIGTTRLLAYFPANTTDLSLLMSETRSGTSLYVVYWRLESTASVSDDVYTDHNSSLVVNKNQHVTGTWKLLHSMSQGVTSKAMIGVWVRIV